MTQIAIRHAQLTNCNALARIQVDSYRTAYSAILPERYLAQFSYDEETKDWHDWLANSDRGRTLLVAQLQTGEWVGYVLSECPQIEISGYDAELCALHVSLAHQRQGIGRALVAAACEYLSAQGCRSVLLWTLSGNPAQAWYERLA